MNTFAFIMAAALLTLILLFFDNIVSSVTMALTMPFSDRRRREMLTSSYHKRSGVISFLISVPAMAFSLHISGVSHVGFVGTLIAVLALVLVQNTTMVLLSSMARDFPASEEIRIGDSFFIIFSLLVFLLAIVSQAFRNCPAEAVRTIFFVLLSILLTIRTIYLSRAIISLKFSHFFTFLYLCGLKLLPIAVAVKAIVY